MVKFAGLNISATDKAGLTALHVACQSGLVKNTQVLLKSGINSSYADTDGNTPLHLACTLADASCAKVCDRSGIVCLYALTYQSRLLRLRIQSW